MDIRKFGITIAVAILSAILIFSIADAIAPQVDYNDCYKTAPYGPDAVKAQRSNCTDAEPDLTAQQACQDGKYSYEARYGTNGCVESYECNTCYKDQQDAQQKRNMIFFYVSIVLGLIFIIIGFFLPLGGIHEWVGLGFIIGGVIGLFIGTVAYWSDLARWVRPLVIAAELGILLYIIYKRVNAQSTPNKKAKR